MFTDKFRNKRGLKTQKAPQTQQLILKRFVNINILLDYYTFYNIKSIKFIKNIQKN